MKAEESIMDYHTDNKKLVVHTEESGKFEKEVDTSSEPDKGKYDAIRRAEREGTATFKDVAMFEEVTGEVYKVQLYYDDKLVGERTTPPIIVQEADRLEITFSLTLQRIDGTVKIKT